MIRGKEWAVSTIRTVLQENLDDRLEEVAALWSDGLEVRAPRPGLRSEGGTYYEMAVDPETVTVFPACSIFAPQSRPHPGVTSGVMHQAHLVTVRFLDNVVGQYDAGKVEELVRRLSRLDAACRDLFIWRKTRLQTLDVPEGIAAGVAWIASRFPEEPGGVKTAEVDLQVRIHETKGT